MKTTIVGLLVLISSASVQAQAPQGKVAFSCNGGNSKYFHATLDYSKYTPGSGFAEMMDAKLADNFITASLICQTQNDPGNFGCVGFLYDRGFEDQIISVMINTNPVTKKITLSHSNGTRSWVCY